MGQKATTHLSFMCPNNALHSQSHTQRHTERHVNNTQRATRAEKDIVPTLDKHRNGLPTHIHIYRREREREREP